MAISALNSAATGLRSLSYKIDVIANNLANAETNAFKRSRVNFEDLMYVNQRTPGARTIDNQVSPAGIQAGLGVRVANTQLDFTQGAYEDTGGTLDVAIKGDGFFRVQVMESAGGEAFTRNGNLFRNVDGDLVVGSRDGYRIVPPVNIPDGARDITITPDGNISYLPAGAGTARATAGPIQLNRFVNPQGLEQLGSNLYRPTDASGDAIAGDPGAGGMGELQQGYLEISNVDPTKELVALIRTQRTFELNSQSIQTADQALQTVANLRRF
jgi:flagellar basal-body rod protein FlgG